MAVLRFRVVQAETELISSGATQKMGVIMAAAAAVLKEDLVLLKTVVTVHKA